MNPILARYTIASLRQMTVAQADRALCEMHSECWHAIALELGITLPTFGSDKPNIIIGQLGLRG